MDRKIPFNQRAGAVLESLRADGDAPLTGAGVIARIADRGPNVGAQLADRLALPGARGGADEPGDAFPIPLERLQDTAEIEAARQGVARVGCEHLVLAVVRLAEDAQSAAAFGTLERARSGLQAMIAENAAAGYEALAPEPAVPGAPAPVGVLFCGLPGAGKSTIAERVAARLGAPSFSFDWFLGTLAPFGVVRADNAAALGGQLLTSALARQLVAGQSAVLDTGGLAREERERWRRVTEKLGGAFVGVECVCSDENAHRARVEARGRRIPGWPATVGWDHVARLRGLWEPWREPHMVIDTVEPLEECVAKVLRAVPGR